MEYFVTHVSMMVTWALLVVLCTAWNAQHFASPVVEVTARAYSHEAVQRKIATRAKRMKVIRAAMVVVAVVSTANLGCHYVCTVDVNRDMARMLNGLVIFYAVIGTIAVTIDLRRIHVKLAD